MLLMLIKLSLINGFVIKFNVEEMMKILKSAIWMSFYENLDLLSILEFEHKY